MLQFLIKRFIGLVFVVLGVTFITFIIGYLAPGDPIRQMMGQHFVYDTWLRLRHSYGLDPPWYQQYDNFLVKLFQFDFGLSFHYHNLSVNDILAEGVPISMELAFWGLIITILIGVPAGILSAVKANTWVDTTNMAVALVFYAVPVFAICVFTQVLIVWIDNQFGIQWPVSNGEIPGNTVGPISNISSL